MARRFPGVLSQELLRVLKVPELARLTEDYLVDEPPDCTCTGDYGACVACRLYTCMECWCWSYLCPVCDAGLCIDCGENLYDCDVCRRVFCPEHVSACPVCGGRYCVWCSNDHNGTCRPLRRLKKRRVK